MNPFSSEHHRERCRFPRIIGQGEVHFSSFNPRQETDSVENHYGVVGIPAQEPTGILAKLTRNLALAARSETLPPSPMTIWHNWSKNGNISRHLESITALPQCNCWGGIWGHYSKWGFLSWCSWTHQDTLSSPVEHQAVKSRIMWCSEYPWKRGEYCKSFHVNIRALKSKWRMTSCQ